jgi:ribonuclease HI
MVPGAGVYCHESRRKLSFSLGRYTTVFRAEVYAFKACTVENLETIKIGTSIFYQLVKLQLKHLANTRSPQHWSGTDTNPSHKWPNITVQLRRVPGHDGIVGNEMADQLARTESKQLFTGPEPDCDISIGVAKKAVRNWMNRNHKKHLEAIM